MNEMKKREGKRMEEREREREEREREERENRKRGKKMDIVCHFIQVGKSNDESLLIHYSKSS